MGIQLGEMKFKTYEEYLKWEEERMKGGERRLSTDELREEYMEKIGEPIALYCIMGNKRFSEEFHEEPSLVYEHCLEHNKTWEEVLGFKEDLTKDY